MDDIIRRNPDEEMTVDINPSPEDAVNILAENAPYDGELEGDAEIPQDAVSAPEPVIVPEDQPRAAEAPEAAPSDIVPQGEVYGESADDVYNDPYYGDDYDDADYGDDYYDDEYYDDEYYEDEYYDEEYPETAGGMSETADNGEAASYYRGPVSHTYDPNGTEDEKPVYGSYYGNDSNAAGSASETSAASAASAASSSNAVTSENAVNSANAASSAGDPGAASEPAKKGTYTSKYDSYRFTAPAGSSSRESGPEKANKNDVKKSKSESKNGGFAKRILSAAALAVVFGGIAAGVFLGVLKMTGFTAPKTAETTEIEQAVPTEIPILGNQESRVTAGKADTSTETVELTVPEVVELCMPSMVAITNTSVEQYYDFFGGAGSRENVSAGSGIIVGETETELLVATNNHVVTNSSEITVTFIDEEAVSGTVKGTDADNDLAVVAVKLDDIKDETKDAIRIVTIGDSDALKVGESVVAIGNALGYGQSVSRGVVSALNREVTVDGMGHQLIQTDASINPGNSGGALLNMRGELIGINEIKYVNTDVEGVGYAIPTATAKPILESLGSKAARSIVDDENASYIGIMCIDVPSYYVQSGYPSGVYVSEVTKGGPAAKAGLKEGDIITAMDGVSVSTTTQLITYLKYYAAGEEIEFSVSRLNEDETAFEKVKMTITLGNRKDSGIDDSKGDESGSSPNETAPEGNDAENGGFEVIPDEKR